MDCSMMKVPGRVDSLRALAFRAMIEYRADRQREGVAMLASSVSDGPKRGCQEGDEQRAAAQH
jgi:hypothetical protein